MLCQRSVDLHFTVATSAMNSVISVATLWVVTGAGRVLLIRSSARRGWARGTQMQRAVPSDVRAIAACKLELLVDSQQRGVGSDQAMVTS